MLQIRKAAVKRVIVIETRRNFLSPSFPGVGRVIKKQIPIIKQINVISEGTKSSIRKDALTKYKADAGRR